MSEKQAYEKKLEAQLDAWSADIDKLKARAEKAEADAQLEIERRVDELQAMREAASDKLTELKNASDGAWEDLRGGIEDAWDSLGEAMRSARSRF